MHTSRPFMVCIWRCAIGVVEVCVCHMTGSEVMYSTPHRKFDVA